MNQNSKSGAAHADSTKKFPRRFYETAALEPIDGEFALTLDGKKARTPAGKLLVLPTLAAGEALAAEWQSIEETLDPSLMPLTRIVNSALDMVANNSDKVRADIVGYAATDLLCYRAGEPPLLVEAQARAWDPVLAWAAEALGARFILVEGLMFAAQPQAALSAVGFAVAEVASPLPLACLHVMTALTGSVLLALAVARGGLSAAEAWVAAHVDEDVQMQTWGADQSAVTGRALRWHEMEAAARLFALV